MSEFVVFDTSVLVDDLLTGRHQERIRSITGLIRTSSVVLAELWRGATRADERDFLRALARNHPILTPTEKNWLDSERYWQGFAWRTVSRRANFATSISTFSSH